jgi:hypothetical protein
LLIFFPSVPNYQTRQSLPLSIEDRDKLIPEETNLSKLSPGEGERVAMMASIHSQTKKKKITSANSPPYERHFYGRSRDGNGAIQCIKSVVEAPHSPSAGDKPHVFKKRDNELALWQDTEPRTTNCPFKGILRAVPWT